MTVECLHSGIRISTIHKGYSVSKLYVGYSKREALKLFREYLKEI